MAYVVPNSVIQLFKGINLDNRYMHTIYFANEQAQDTAFTAKVFKTFNASQFVRQNATQVKVECDSTELQGVTYLRFKNTRTGSKWYYAFVIGAPQYVNENTSLITFEIDVMQTWFIQAGSVLPCMVKREHVSTDVLGANLESEPCGNEAYVNDELSYSSVGGDLFSNYKLIVNWSEAAPRDKIINNGLVNGTQYEILDAEDSNAVWNEINALVTLMNGSWQSGDRPIDVIDMFTFPSKFCNTEAGYNKYSLNITRPTTIDGYAPKNKKLMTYPYSCLQLSTKNGESSMYKWEYFETNGSVTASPEFKAYGAPIGGGQIICYPMDYSGVHEDIDDSISIDDFPKNPFTYDAYQAWVASGGKTKLEYAGAFAKMRGITGLLSASSNALSSGYSGFSNAGIAASEMYDAGEAYSSGISRMTRGVNSIVQSGLSLVNKAVDYAEAKNKITFAFKDAMYHPNQVIGKSVPNLAIGDRKLNFYFFHTHLKLDEAKRVDDFFSMYGYATNRIKTPNITGRQYWNFVQTENCQIAGDMPASSKEAIGRIFDGGITFWHNINQIGNYAQSVTSGTVNNPIV